MPLYRDGTGKYQDEYELLCATLVPGSGSAKTPPGELVRSILRLADEYYRNGLLNWGEMFEGMAELLEEVLNDKQVFSAGRLTQIRKDVARIKRDGKSGRFSYSKGRDHIDRLTDAVVEWCQANASAEETARRKTSLNKGQPLKQLFNAIKTNDLQRVSEIISAERKLISKRATSGEPSLIYALRCGNYDAVRLLVEAGANVNVRHKSYPMPPALMFVVGYWCDCDTLKLFLEKGADPNVPNRDSEYPLLTAVRIAANQCGDVDDKKRSQRMVKLLLKYGADPNLTPKFHKYAFSARSYLNWHIDEYGKKSVPRWLLNCILSKSE